MGLGSVSQPGCDLGRSVWLGGRFCLTLGELADLLLGWAWHKAREFGRMGCLYDLCNIPCLKGYDGVCDVRGFV